MKDTRRKEGDMPDLDLYWGELHNHNELGYAQGSLGRSYEIARFHLDFYAFTPHGLHADGGAPDGYPVVVANWEPEARRLDYRVEGWDALKSVEVVRNNFPVHIEVPDYGTPRAAL